MFFFVLQISVSTTMNKCNGMSPRSYLSRYTYISATKRNIALIMRKHGFLVKLSQHTNINNPS